MSVEDKSNLEDFIKSVNERMQAIMACEFTDYECKQVQVTVGDGRIQLGILLIDKKLLQRAARQMVTPAGGGPFQA